MQRNRDRISERSRKRFLQLAAIALAVGGTGLAAAAADERSPRTVAAPAADGHSGHAFALPRDGHERFQVARIAVIALACADAFTVEASGPCAVGPLAPGPYALRITLGQQTDRHLIRIDGGTGAYLYFIA